MKHPKISIVIPSYNKARFISQTLDSIVAQKYPNLEVIIQDAGSTDGTLEIVKRYARKHPKVFMWESKKDNGQHDAINKGLDKATGEIVTFINADDIYMEGAFHEVAATYEKNPQSLWFAGNGIVIDSKGREIAKAVTFYKSLCLFLNFHFSLLIFNFLMQPSVFLTREAYVKFGPFTGTSDYVTEYDLWLRLSQIQMPIVINPALTKFRIESTTKTQQMSKELLKEDEKIAMKYTKNYIILALHKLHNIGRLIIGGWI